MIDFIGDIHGHAKKLEELLQKLGYTQKSGVYSHPRNKVLFVGDYIDRGPEIRKTLKIVKAMTDNGNAIALMGNHEYNALCFYYKNPDGGHLRKHTIKNIVQHYKTLKQFQNKEKEYEMYIDWFKTLPLFYEGPHFRAVHACWDTQQIALLRNKLVNDRLTEELIKQSINKKSDLHLALEDTLKGKEMPMPEGKSFTDKDGTKRKEIRIKWWEDPTKMTYKSISVEPITGLPDEKINVSNFEKLDFYTENEKKVFFGHYWLKGAPSLYKKNICCLDYSIAKGGNLVAYRLDDENELNQQKFVYVSHKNS